MGKLLDWAKRNWLLIIIVIGGYIFIRNFFGISLMKQGSLPRGYGGPATSSMSSSGYGSDIMVEEAPAMIGKGIPRESPPAVDVKDRLVIRNSTLSLLVKNVKNAQQAILRKAENLGGYMVDSRIESPEGIDSANITIRVPETKLDSMLEFIRDQGVRVVTENLVGHDVTDEYVDIEAHQMTLQKTQKKFEEILDKATKVQDILQVQREIINLQTQIDNLVGQKQYLEKSSQTAKITIYISTDEYSLPYAPPQPWRPGVVFKTAIRSLVLALRNIGSLVIWIVVFSVVWLPALIIFLIVKKIKKKKQAPPPIQ